MWNSGSLLRKSLIFTSSSEVSKQKDCYRLNRTAKDISFLCLSSLVNYLFIVYPPTPSFFFWDWDPVQMNYRRVTWWKVAARKKLVAELFAPELLTDTCQNVDLGGMKKGRTNSSHCTTAIHVIVQQLSCSCVVSTRLRAGPTVNQNLMGYWNIL